MRNTLHLLLAPLLLLISFPLLAFAVLTTSLAFSTLFVRVALIYAELGGVLLQNYFSPPPSPSPYISPQTSAKTPTKSPSPPNLRPQKPTQQHRQRPLKRRLHHPPRTRDQRTGHLQRRRRDAGFRRCGRVADPECRARRRRWAVDEYEFAAGAAHCGG